MFYRIDVVQNRRAVEDSSFPTTKKLLSQETFLSISYDYEKTQQKFTCTNPTIKALEKGKKYVQS